MDKVIYEEDLVKVVRRCSCCRREYEFKDETKEDCWWQMDMDGWVTDSANNDICPACMNLP